MVSAMDLDLDLFERGRRRDRSGSHRVARSRSRHRRRHPHVFAWLVLGGGALLVALALIALASSLGAWGALADGYFHVTTAILPASWHDEWLALPGIAHVGLALGALVVVVGLLGEVFD